MLKIMCPSPAQQRASAMSFFVLEAWTHRDGIYVWNEKIQGYLLESSKAGM